MSKQSKRYTPYNNGVITSHRSTLSSHITVVGRSAISENPRRPSFIYTKTQRLSHSKLKALQKHDEDIRKRVLQDRMTTREQADLTALQCEISGSNEPQPPLDEACDDHAVSPDDEWEDMEDDEDLAPADKPISFKELGLPAERTEWSDRLANEHSAWVEQVSALCDAYLAYRSGNSTLEPERDHQNHMVDVLCVDVAVEGRKSFSHNNDDPWINPTLVRHGYLSPSPRRPRMAFSILLLELLAAVQRRGPAMSIQVMGKAFCDLRNVPYETHFHDQLTAALDAFLMIEREVERRLAVAMGRDDPDWRLKNVCMPCTYRLEDEPPMQYSMLVTMDGNDSLKHVAGAGAADHRTYESSYYLTQAQVDVCANEVPRRRKKDEPQEETECEKRWKSARPDNDPRKRAKLMFEETGVFVSTCRHSHVLTVCDMVRSGELAKYGLSTVDRLTSIHGERMLFGYDCGCSFEGTIFRAPTIGPRARAAKLRCCTGAFHGPAHNRTCQLKYHSRYFPGAGLTDFENCETLFSSSNRLASSTRFASKYHRHQRIHRHLDGWDDDQHANLGRLLRSKYKSALAVIERAEASISHLAPDVPSDRLENFLEWEEKYLAALKVEDPDNTKMVEYLELRERLETLETEYNTHRKTFVSYNPSSGDLRKAAATNRIEARARNTMNQLFTVQQAVADFEEKHNISIPWTRSMKEWTDAEDIRRNRDLQRCIDDLERLSVQRIFELSRAGLRGLGYKLRMHIMKAVNNRSAALKSALERYNNAAAKVGLPAMLWETLTSVSVLADFDLLRGSRTGVLEEEWALPSNRRAAEEYQYILRAKEEILRLDIEVRRVHTAISDERQELPKLAEQIAAASPELQWAANRYIERRLKVNDHIMRDLNVLMHSNQYTGSRDTGVRVGSHLHKDAQLSAQALAGQPPVTLVDGNDTLLDTADADVDEEPCDTFDKVQAVFESLSM
ncbi:hypothetical protein FS749_000325 [Ceratobasidium sp. UAMH 11750]|nr:hypothetical protein FS749_000325 [Ceratobasidium sp. UAMH 11750]